MENIHECDKLDSVTISKKRFLLIKHLILINSFLPLEAFLAPVVVLYYLKYVSVTLWEYSNFISAIFILNMVLEVPLGVVSDKVGWNKSYLIGRVIYFLGLSILLIYPGRMVLIPSAILLSVGGSLASGNLESIAYDASSKSHNEDSYQPILKRASSIGILVSALASITGGYLAAKNIAYPMILDLVFLGTGTLISIICLLILWPGKDIVVNTTSPKKISNNKKLSEIKEIVFLPDFFIPMIISTLLFVVMRTSLNFYQPFLAEHRWSSVNLGYLFAISIVISMVISTLLQKSKNMTLRKLDSTFLFLLTLIIGGISFFLSGYIVAFFIVGFIIHQLARISLPAMTSFEQHNAIPIDYPYRTTLLSFGFLLRSLATSIGMTISGFFVNQNITISIVMFYLHIVVMFIFMIIYFVGIRMKNAY
ncbi:MFS transporter [Pseudescherichia sp.]|uniref:MFS transporter n=1 Tax=Pseudescherichia sp. TaxID=2055881 RepID=UPI0028A1332C|nr:MFS transporter [Pseudescherichia sp.]